MTMSYLQNCPHQKKGWCLDCVQKSHEEFESSEKRLKDAKEIEIKALKEGLEECNKAIQGILDSVINVQKQIYSSSLKRMTFAELEKESQQRIQDWFFPPKEITFGPDLWFFLDACRIEYITRGIGHIFERRYSLQEGFKVWMEDRS